MEGLLGGILNQLKASGLNAKTGLENGTVIIEFSADDIKNAITKGMNEQAKKLIDLELHEGKMTIKIKLF
ncbi:MAG: hypothetical protein CBR30_09715 [Dictyoglomus sp. NZ13-RE01]|nr:MAG: hypothetical protein CBR30_09715 [Dictyoglomus sp. NZ13-RE01]